VAKGLMAVAIIWGISVGAGCNSAEEDGADNAGERHRIDEHAGTYYGVGIDQTAKDVRRQFGPAPPWKRVRHGPLTPTGRDYGDISLPPRAVCAPGPQERYMLYRLVSFAVRAGRVCRFMVIEDGAATNTGVAIGDPLEDAEDAYPNAVCADVNSELGFVEYRYCESEVTPNRHVWFGGDPIDTIAVSEARFLGS
jgi:hypothetical protein